MIVLAFIVIKLKNLFKHTFNETKEKKKDRDEKSRVGLLVCRIKANCPRMGPEPKGEITLRESLFKGSYPYLHLFWLKLQNTPND